jgi:hypothetical protein
VLSGVPEQDHCPFVGISGAETSGICEYNYTDKDETESE